MEVGATVLGSTRAMATEVTVHGLDGAPAPARDATRRALDVFHEVERVCTRFDPRSPLMRLNAASTRWHRVPPTLYLAMREAHRAHQRTKGRFDPRVLNDLVALGYDHSLAFSNGEVRTRRTGGPARRRDRGDPAFAAGLDPRS